MSYEINHDGTTDSYSVANFNREHTDSAFNTARTFSRKNTEKLDKIGASE